MFIFSEIQFNSILDIGLAKCQLIHSMGRTFPYNYSAQHGNERTKYQIKNEILRYNETNTSQ